MTQYKFEYIWLDGEQPVPELRRKSLLQEFAQPPALANISTGGFDEGDPYPIVSRILKTIHSVPKAGIAASGA